MDYDREDDDLGEYPGPAEPDRPPTLTAAAAAIALSVVGALSRRLMRHGARARAAPTRPGH